MPVQDPVHIGVIGGTGIQRLDDFSHVATLRVSTPWGEPSSPITILHHSSPSSGSPVPIAFISRHGLQHELAPHEVPSRANIAALRSIGVRTVVAFSAVGSLQEEIKPRDFVVPDQIIDRTKGIRPFTYFEGGMVGHVGFADPFDEGLAKIVRQCGHSLEGDGVEMHDRGTLICMGALSRPSWLYFFLAFSVSMSRLQSLLSPRLCLHPLEVPLESDTARQNFQNRIPYLTVSQLTYRGPAVQHPS